MTASSKTTHGQSQNILKKHKNKIIMGAVAVGAILLIGFLFSGGTTPKGSLGSIFEPLPVYKTSQGAINGYVYGPLGLPAVGASVVAAQQGGSAKAATAFISIDGKYVLQDLPPGQYILYVSFPDGANKVLDNIRIQAGTVQTINVKY
ncbi:MAG: carboxypeptidase-like regulatory domain-containing protein [Thermoproteota archaeon]|nr:carboxypeptidase-like regulatory domain-containing protein [Thermoproteota archaeon]